MHLKWCVPSNAWKLLEGVRGLPARPNLINRGNSSHGCPSCRRISPRVSELDINPLMISDKDGEAIAVDAR